MYGKGIAWMQKGNGALDKKESRWKADRQEGDAGKRYEQKCERQGDQFRLVEMHRAFWQKYSVYERNTSSRHCKPAIVK